MPNSLIYCCGTSSIFSLLPTLPMSLSPVFGFSPCSISAGRVFWWFSSKLAPIAGPVPVCLWSLCTPPIFLLCFFALDSRQRFSLLFLRTCWPYVTLGAERVKGACNNASSHNCHLHACSNCFKGILGHLHKPRSGAGCRARAHVLPPGRMQGRGIVGHLQPIYLYLSRLDCSLGELQVVCHDKFYEAKNMKDKNLASIYEQDME